MSDTVIRRLIEAARNALLLDGTPSAREALEICQEVDAAIAAVEDEIAKPKAPSESARERAKRLSDRWPLTPEGFAAWAAEHGAISAAFAPYLVARVRAAKEAAVAEERARAARVARACGALPRFKAVSEEIARRIEEGKA